MAEKPTYEELEVRVKELENTRDRYTRFEEALKESEAKYRTIIETIPNGYYISTPEGYYVDANPAFIRMLGYDGLSELRSIHIPTGIYVDTSERILLNPTSEFIDKVETYRVKRKDGQIIWIEDNARYIKNNEGDILYHQGIFKDITGRKHAEEINSVLFEISNAVNTSQDLEELYASIHKSLGRIIDVTNFHISLYDRELDTLTFVYWIDTVDQPPKNFQIHNITGPRTIAHTAEVIVTGKPVLHSKAQFVEILRKRGVSPGFSLSEIWLGVPLKIKDEVIGAMVAHSFSNPNLYTQQDAEILLSVSNQVAIAIQQKRTESALRESVVRFRVLIEQAPEAIVVYDVDLDQVVDVNAGAERLFGCSRKELVQYGLQRFYSPEPSDRQGGAHDFAELCRQALAGEEIKFERAAHSADGRDLLCEVHLVRLPSEQGRLLRFSLIDITKRRHAEEEKAKLEILNRQLHKNQSLNRMAGAIAHHFNNQLGVVIGNLEMALDDLPEDAVSGNHLAEAMLGAQRAAEVSGQMLTYLGQTTGQHVAIDLSVVCREILPLLQAIIPIGLRLQADFPLPGPNIKGNANQLQQVLTNLVTNACEAIGNSQGVIDLSCNTVLAADIQGGHRFPINWQPQAMAYACMQVVDTGCGIGDTDVDNLFDPFFSSKLMGRGLGLPVALGIAIAHEGAFTVTSVIGQGSRFQVFFPLSAEEISRPPLEIIPEFSPIEGRGTVLLVDDDEMVRNMAERMLSRVGYNVLVAEDGIEAVELFQLHANKIDVVLCDLSMPRMGGWETLAALRRIRPGLPVVLASGHDQSHVFTTERLELPQAFLHKPYKRSELMEALAKAMSGAVEE